MNVKNYITREPKDKLKILTFCTHERYESQLCKTGHEFYSLDILKKWEGTPPSNYYVMNRTNFINSGYDLILSQSRFGQFSLASKINQSLQIPIITLEHTVPTVDIQPKQLDIMSKMVGDVNVFISQYSSRVWNNLHVHKNTNVIEHCVDTEVFKPNGKRHNSFILTVANDFKNRDYCLNYKLWSDVKNKTIYPMIVVGKNNSNIDSSFSEAKDINELVDFYNSAAIYLNTTSHSTIPMSLLEAMACGCPIITTDTCAISEYIVDGYNGLIANTSDEILSCIKQLETSEIREYLGNNARQTILERCSQERFVQEWNEIFRKTYEASL